MSSKELTFRQITLRAVDALKAIKPISDSAISRLAFTDDRTVARLRRGDSIGSELLETLYARVRLLLSETEPGTSCEIQHVEHAQTTAKTASAAQEEDVPEIPARTSECAV